MRQQLLLLVVLLAGAITSQAQDIQIDPQKMAAGREKPDSDFVKYLSDVADAYGGNIDKNDSAEFFYLEGLAIATKINYEEGIIECRNSLADYYFRKGKLTQSLDLYLKNQAFIVDKGDSSALFSNLRVISSIYLRIGDIGMAKTSLDRRQYILDHNGIKGLKDTSYAVLSQYNSLAQYYNFITVNQQDSVEYYFRKMYVKGQHTERENLFTQLGAGGLGAYFTGQAKYDSSFYFYKIAISAAEEGKRIDNYYGFLANIADAYRKAGIRDSAFAYAYKVFNGATKYSYLSQIVMSSGVLANLYKETHQYDSAVKYMTSEAKYKDSLYSRETLKSIQLMTTTQQQKELDKQREKEKAIEEYKSKVKTYSFIGGLVLLLAVIGFMFRINKQRAKARKEIETAYHELKSTQAQLVQSEKMASLGELTAGIAHEIQNPLNFVNNFSEVSNELIDEMKEELVAGNQEQAIMIAEDVKQNLEKINHHGKRADAIVKGMLQHSRSSGGQKEPTDINALCDEYLRLSYHGLRAKDSRDAGHKNFNATLKTDFDPSIGKINVIPQDIGRVIMNLLTNAFYAVQLKTLSAGLPPTAVVPETAVEKYEPTVSISTKKIGDKIEIRIADNGGGIPSNIIDKIFQPFFTTKPTGQGTGLGLSLSYDIVTKGHGGELFVISPRTTAEGGGEGTEFILQLPANAA